MAFKVYPMKKETIRKKNRDQILWEEFVSNNNVKKKVIRVTEAKK